MAERRMFAKSIVLSDAFLDMPLSARCLYFTLGMLADDDGFVGSPKAIMRQCGASQDDMAVLLQKRYILAFESGVIVIKHWRMNNYLQNDRHKSTTYIEELSTLAIDDKGAYTETAKTQTFQPMYTECIQNVYEMDTQDSIGKDRIDKNRLVKDNNSLSESMSDRRSDKDEIVKMWNTLEPYGIKTIRGIVEGSKRMEMVRARLKQYTLGDIETAIDNIRQSDFLQGKNKNGWTITFDWFIKPNNFIKVLENNYDNKSSDGLVSTGSAYMDAIINRVNVVDTW